MTAPVPGLAPVRLRPGRALAEGIARMIDFTGTLGPWTPGRTIEHDFNRAWATVLGASPRRLA